MSKRGRLADNSDSRRECRGIASIKPSRRALCWAAFICAMRCAWGNVCATVNSFAIYKPDEAHGQQSSSTATALSSRPPPPPSRLISILGSYESVCRVEWQCDLQLANAPKHSEEKEARPRHNDDDGPNGRIDGVVPVAQASGCRMAGGLNASRARCGTSLSRER